MSQKLRNPLFDVIKALMMVWVVWGHLGLYGITPHLVEPSSRYEIWKRERSVFVCGLIFLGIVFCEGDSSLNGMNFWKVNASWRVVLFSWHAAITFILRTVVGLTGSLFVMGAVDRIIARFPRLCILAQYGQTRIPLT